MAASIAALEYAAALASHIERQRIRWSTITGALRPMVRLVRPVLIGCQVCPPSVLRNTPCVLVVAYTVEDRLGSIVWGSIVWGSIVTVHAGMLKTVLQVCPASSDRWNAVAVEANSLPLLVGSRVK